MNSETSSPRKRPIKTIIVVSIIIILSAGAVFLYNNFNRLLSESLIRSFNSSIVSDVYELKFENLQVNPFEGSIRVFNVTLQPRETPLRSYPYINSSFRLRTDKITLKNVQLFELLKSSVLKLERITIRQPDIQLTLAKDKHVLLPLKDSTSVTGQPAKTKKKTIDSFTLNEFELIDATFHVTNAAKQREFSISKFNISLHDLTISQYPGKDLISLKQADLSIGDFKGSLKKGAIRHIKFKDYKMKIDSLKLQHTVDTLIFNFDDFNTSFKDFDIHTADSIYHISMQSFDLSHKKKSVKLVNLLFKPNISDAAMQKRFKYQHTQLSATAGSMNLIHVNFDSLIYHKALFIDEIVLDKVKASIFKDNTKPMDPNHLPVYFGEQIKAIPLPLRIKHVKVTHIHLINTERKKDSSYAKVTIQRGTAEVKNITNRSLHRPLTLKADAYLENKVHFNLRLDFDYVKPQFSMDGKLEKFNLPDLNPVIQAYTPAKINTGTADEIIFSGTVAQTNSTGTMKFLYHDLKVDLELQQKAKWKSSVLAFAANTAVHSSNPATANVPPRIVQFHAERDMHKGFINIIIKSVLQGIKETMIMSKENRKSYKDAKKKSRNQISN